MHETRHNAVVEGPVAHRRLLLRALLVFAGVAVALLILSRPAAADEAEGDVPETLDATITDDVPDETTPLGDGLEDGVADGVEDGVEDGTGDGSGDAADPTSDDTTNDELADEGAGEETPTDAPVTLDAQPVSGLEDTTPIDEAPGQLDTSVDDPDCPSCSSEITQELVSRTFDTDHWTIVIEATLDSNVVCHLFLFQCVVQPEQAPTNMTLVSVQCLSPGWAHVYIDVFGFTRDVCARFDHHQAGNDQRFRFTYRTDPGVVSGTVSEKVVFYRFPEEIFFVRAMDTIVVDLDVELDATKTCSDVVTAGTSSACTITLSYPGAGPAVTTVSMTDTPPAEFINGALIYVSGSGTWNCVALTCTLVGNYSPGNATTFAFSFDVTPAADGEVVNTATGNWNSGSASDTAEITVQQPTDTTLNIIKVVDGGPVRPGDPVSWTIIVTNEGPVAAVNVRVRDMPGEFVQGALMVFDSGVGVWTCTLLECTTPSMPLGSATFSVNGFVADNAPPGTIITNEAEVEWDNDVFGPDFPIRVGAQVVVAEPPAPPGPPEPPAPGPLPTADQAGTDQAGTLPLTGSGGLSTLLLAGVLLMLGGVVLTSARGGSRTPTPSEEDQRV